MKYNWKFSLLLGAATIGVADSGFSHGFAGDRFFPPTLQTDDPFAVDELAFPTISTTKSPLSDDGPATRTTDISLEFDKEILPRFALGVEEDYVFVAPDGQRATHGFDNTTLSLKYELWINDSHEAIVSAGAEWEIGGTGSRQIGRDAGSTFTPTIYFGKGLGDLPDALNYAKPFAITGTVGETLPTKADPNNLEWGFALEYNLQYLQTEVKDVGLSGVFQNLIPVVEFSFETPENRGGGRTTGTINPGLLYENNYFQIGAEAIIPANGQSGQGIGAIFSVQIFIDDIWPKVFGFPIAGKK